MTASEYLLFVCSTAGGDDAGVYSFAVDSTDGTATALSHTPVEHPAYLATHPDGDVLYAVNRVDGGVLSAYEVDHETGVIRELVRRSSGGAGPCYVSVDPTGRCAFAANYDGGSVAAFPLHDDGRPREASHVVNHEGSGPDPDRQASPHPHAVCPGPRGEFAYVPDLGLDRIGIYRIDFADDRFGLSKTPGVELAAASGPRHLAFSPDGESAFAVNELDSTVTRLTVDSESGAMVPVDSASTVPIGSSPADNSPADVHVHPSGRWVYASNRGHDSVVVFDIDGTSERLRTVGHRSTRGRRPRDFVLDPTGQYLFAENRDSGTVVTFALDEDTGLPSDVRAELAVPKPTCAVFAERERDSAG